MEPLFVFLFFSAFLVLLFTGFPVAFVLGGVAVLFALLGSVIEPLTSADVATPRMLAFVSNRVFDTLSSYSLIPMAMFVFMGFMLDRSGVAERLLTSMRRILGPTPGGMAIAVVLIGVVLAASTGIVGASVVLLAAIALPTMAEAGYDRRLSYGTVSATGCLGILIPPSIMLVVMGDQLRIPVSDLFMGAVVPGLLLALLYALFIVVMALLRPALMPAWRDPNPVPLMQATIEVFRSLVAPLALIVAILGSIVMGIASPTEASGVGAAGATLLAWANGSLSRAAIMEVCAKTAKTTGFLYMLIFGATCFSVVLRGYGGDEVIENALHALPLSPTGVLIFILVIIFFLGFFLDWMEIVLIVAPLVLPVLTTFGFDPVWVALLLAVCLQTSFITPPVGVALFYLKTAHPEAKVSDLYLGAVPFVALQLAVLAAMLVFPQLALWLPEATR